MGFFSDLVIADEDEAQALVDSIHAELDYEGWNSLLLEKNIGELELGALWELLTRQQQDLVIDKELLFVGSEEEGGILVCSLSNDFTHAIAQVDHAIIPSIASGWSATEEMGDYPVPDLIDLLTTLVSFARKAVELGKPILIIDVL